MIAVVLVPATADTCSQLFETIEIQGKSRAEKVIIQPPATDQVRSGNSIIAHYHVGQVIVAVSIIGPVLFIIAQAAHQKSIQVEGPIVAEAV